MIQVPLMKTINFATKADISDRFYSGNIKEIVNTFSYSCEKCACINYALPEQK